MKKNIPLFPPCYTLPLSRESMSSYFKPKLKTEIIIFYYFTGQLSSMVPSRPSQILDLSGLMDEKITLHIYCNK